MMTLPKRFNANETEARLLESWARNGTYAFQKGADKPVYSIDTPPATVSGHLHLGHIYSYTHADLMARYFRMNGYNVFYPMGFDDNGLPTDRLLEKTIGEQARRLDREAYAQKCLELGKEFGQAYRELWTRLGLSIDWNHTYRTISPTSRKTAQWSFLDLYKKGLIYRQEAPTQWCPECGTGIAQAEVDDLERESEFITLAFTLADEETLEIATTRPELLPACVAIFVHPEDQRNQHLIGQKATVPLFGQSVPILADPAADPKKGTGVVMCCTFGDAADVIWWQEHNLPLIAAIDRQGRMTDAAGQYTGLPVAAARKQIKADLDAAGLLLDRRPIIQTVRVHERCDTPIEYIVTRQWFVKVLEYKEDLLTIGAEMDWHPPHMQSRYQSWVENLAWDWCISRQRHFGVPFPAWFCVNCGEVVLATEEQLPIDPTNATPSGHCPACSGEYFRPETDVMDTWATSSLTPQLAGQWLSNPELYAAVYPFSLRPQAHEIIRTWAFYTIVKAHHHGWEPPWQELGISGWGIAAPGQGKISKSRGGGP
ncbi:MAG: valine--tRNA ligase, partial [Anaerolineales bacterium]|nr:valine--tRNA ligase [Anaerolineales bacterium]